MGRFFDAHGHIKLYAGDFKPTVQDRLLKKKKNRSACQKYKKSPQKTKKKHAPQIHKAGWKIKSDKPDGGKKKKIQTRTPSPAHSRYFSPQFRRYYLLDDPLWIVNAEKKNQNENVGTKNV